MTEVELYRFAHWVASEVFQDDFEENAGAFAELCCRKLHYLGMVKKQDENGQRLWHYEPPKEET